MKVYSRLGDQGMTSTLCGERIAKDDCLCEVSGDIDSLQAQIEKLLLLTHADMKKEYLHKIYFKLSQLNGELSDHKIGHLIKHPVTKKDVEELEKWIDSMNLKIKGFQRFNTHFSINVNEARIRTRKLERSITSYLRDEKLRANAYEYINRLSSYFFALAVKLNG